MVGQRGQKEGGVSVSVLTELMECDQRGPLISQGGSFVFRGATALTRVSSLSGRYIVRLARHELSCRGWDEWLILPTDQRELILVPLLDLAQAQVHRHCLVVRACHEHLRIRQVVHHGVRRPEPPLDGVWRVPAAPTTTRYGGPHMPGVKGEGGGLTLPCCRGPCCRRRATP